MNRTDDPVGASLEGAINNIGEAARLLDLAEDHGSLFPQEIRRLNISLTKISETLVIYLDHHDRKEFYNEF